MRNIQFEDHTGAARAALEAALSAALEAIGAAAVGYARQALADSGAVDTGALRDSVVFEISGRALSVGSALPYAAAIELGDGANRAARPYISPALLEHGPEYAEMVRQALREATR